MRGKIQVLLISSFLWKNKNHHIELFGDIQTDYCERKANQNKQMFIFTILISQRLAEFALGYIVATKAVANRWASCIDGA